MNWIKTKLQALWAWMTGKGGTAKKQDGPGPFRPS